MKDFIQCLILTIIAIGLLRVIRNYYPAIGVPSSLAIVVALTGIALSVFLPVIEYVNFLAEQYSIKYLSVLWKSLAISILSSTAADICRSSDEGAIAEKVELLGKCELLVLSLPLIRELTELIIEISENTL